MQMNPFVNDQKRDLELPEGCKDLVDVLQMTKPGSEPKSKWKLVHDLKEAERFLATLLLSPARLGNLYIAVPRQEQYVQITYGSGGLTVALSIIGGTPGRLRAVRSLFHHAGVVPIADQISSYVIPLWRLLIYPLPAVAPDAAELIAQVLRRGFGLPEKTQFYFSYEEKDNA